MRKSQLVAGILSVGIYIFVVLLLVLYFNDKQHNKAKRYVKKNEHRIQVSLASDTQVPAILKPKVKHRVKPKPKSKPKKTPPKKTRHSVVKKPKVHKKITKKEPKRVQKKVIHKKVVQKDTNRTKKHIVKKQDLFASIKVPKKHNILVISDKPIVSKPKNNLIKISDKKPSALQKVNNSLRKQKSMDSGVTNLYLARVQEMLEDWPAQSDFAGQSVKVLLYIKPSGMFDFEIKSASTNPEFNQALVDYLKQLQVFGFGKHEGSRTYRFEANFVAKE